MSGARDASSVASVAEQITETFFGQRIAVQARARACSDAITFKSLGIGLEDLAVAALVYDRALASGCCKPL